MSASVWSLSCRISARFVTVASAAIYRDPLLEKRPRKRHVGRRAERSAALIKNPVLDARSSSSARRLLAHPGEWV